MRRGFFSLAWVSCMAQVGICAAQVIAGRPIELGCSGFLAVFLMLASIASPEEKDEEESC